FVDLAQVEQEPSVLQRSRWHFEVVRIGRRSREVSDFPIRRFVPGTQRGRRGLVWCGIKCDMPPGGELGERRELDPGGDFSRRSRGTSQHHENSILAIE